MRIEKRVVILLSCLTIVLLTILPIRSIQNAGSYDPWLDVNDDNRIDMKDVAAVAKAFYTFNPNETAVNKTELLLHADETYTRLMVEMANMENLVEELNLTELLNEISLLRSEVAQLNDTVHNQGQLISMLNETLYQLYSYYPLRLSTADSQNYDWTTEQYPHWVNMSGMLATLTLTRPSKLVIMLDAELQNLGSGSATAPENTTINVRALVNGNVTLPTEFGDPSIEPNGFNFLPYHSHYLRWGSYTFIFHTSTLYAGQYQVYIQWNVSAGEGEVGNRTLMVMAIPL